MQIHNHSPPWSFSTPIVTRSKAFIYFVVIRTPACKADALQAKKYITRFVAELGS